MREFYQVYQFFHQSRCPHSKAIQPEWEKASIALEEKKQYVVGRVNCQDSGKTLCEKFEIKIYPTVSLFRHGTFQENYAGPRTAGKEILLFFSFHFIGLFCN